MSSYNQEGREHKQRELAKSEIYAERPTPGKPSPRPKTPRNYGLEYRVHPDHRRPETDRTRLFPNRHDWKPYFKWYETAQQRDMAKEQMDKQAMPGQSPFYEYRPIERT